MASNVGGIMNVGLESMWKDAVVFLIITIETQYTVGTNEE